MRRLGRLALLRGRGLALWRGLSGRRTAARGRASSSRRTATAGWTAATRWTAAARGTAPSRRSSAALAAGAAEAASATAAEPAPLPLGRRLGLGPQRRQRTGHALTLEADPDGVGAGLLARDLVPSVALQVLHPSHRRLAELVGSGSLGEVRLVENLFACHGDGG